MKPTSINTIRNVLLILLFIAGLFVRVSLYAQSGRDNITFFEAVNDFLDGDNPYYRTLRSFEDPDKTSSGYAYFPGLLYVFSILYRISEITSIPHEILWKIPTLLSDIAVFYILYKLFKDKDWWVPVIACAVWFLNPYLMLEMKYTYNDTIPALFLLLSLIYLERNSPLSGFFYALAVLFKPFGLFIFPVYLLKSKSVSKFIIAGGLTGLIFSIPFLKSWDDFITYISGALLFHGGRGIMGRPFLYYISFNLKLEFIQLIPLKVLTFLAAFSGWVLIIIFDRFSRLRDKYFLALVSALSFYIFTPVFNRTYFLWFLPVIIIATEKLPGRKYIFPLVMVLFYAFYIWYLWQWDEGYHIQKPWLIDNEN